MKAKRPIRVLHVIDGLGGGGSERWVWDIVRKSNGNEFVHRVVTVHPVRKDFIYAEPLAKAGAYDGSGVALRTGKAYGDSLSALASSFRWLPSRLKWVARPFWNLLEMSQVALGRTSTLFDMLGEYMRFSPDIIHSHTFYGHAYGLFLKVFSRCPLVHTVPCLISQMTDAGYDWMGSLYRRFHKYVDRFFTAYPGELIEMGVPVEKIMQLKGGVDLKLMEDAEAKIKKYRMEIRQRLGIAREAPIALSVGRLHRSKGHQYGLDAVAYLVKRFPNLQWIVLGEGPDRSLLELHAKELRIAGHVHFIGYVIDPLPWYAAADIYFRTTIFEGENLSSFQAMAMGLPVIGFDTKCETDLIRRVGHGILVPNKDGGAFAAAVEHVLTLPDQGRTMGALGANFCRAHLDIQESIMKFLTTYKDLCNTVVSPSDSVRESVRRRPSENI